MSKKTTEASQTENTAAEAKPAAVKPAGAPPQAQAPQPGAAADSPLTPEQIAELRAKAAKAEENWDKYVRAYADLENYRKRTARELQDVRRYANEDLLGRLIPVLDNLDAALSATGNAETASFESLKSGLGMVYSQFKGVLREAGLEEIDAAGKTFDPSLHEAVSQRETADVPEGQVVQQLRKGYKLKDRLIRPATVIVARKPAA